MKKEKLSKRILNAARALRGEPWPQVYEFAAPKLEVTPLRLETFQAECSVPLMAVDMQGPENTAAEARQDLARLIGRKLMDAGAIRVTKSVDLAQGVLTYRARVQVAMPEEDDNG